MITLVTGTPGAGKTAYVVSILADYGNRPIYINGIPGLTVEHFPTPPVDEWTSKTEVDGTLCDYFTGFQEGSLIVLDECQRIYRPRGASSAVPAIVAAFETHRHRGLDFILITQHPNLLDFNVRRLVGKHIHLRPTALGRYLHEWPESNDPDVKSNRAASVKRKYKLPKQVFGQYKSAEVHTKNPRRLPISLFVVGIALLSLVAGIVFMKTRVDHNLDAKKENLQPQDTAQPWPVAASFNGASEPVKLTSFVSPTPGYPEYAPAYDDLRKVTAMPSIVGCVKTKKSCHCYSQQFSKITDIPLSRCDSFLHGGEFNPFKDDLKGRGEPGHIEASPVPPGRNHA